MKVKREVTVWRRADGKPIKTDVAAQFPHLTRRERRQMVRDLRKLHSGMSEEVKIDDRLHAAGLISPRDVTPKIILPGGAR